MVKFFVINLIIIVIIIILLLQKIRELQSNNQLKSEIFTSISETAGEITLKQSDLNIFKEFNNVWNEIFHMKSFEDSIVLMKTLKFMVKDVDEYDPELVEFVRTLIKPPSKLPLNLINKNAEDYSQLGQSTYMNTLLKSKRNGFFIESGGHDGEYISNSLYFEKKFNWSGLLIEPIPSSFKVLSTKNRNAYTLNACIAKKKPFVTKFRVAHVFSGRQDQIDSYHLNYLNKYVDKSKATEYMPCFSLNTILHAINVKNVDMFSLDIEGGEWDVIESIDYTKYNINLFCIEHNHLKFDKKKIYNHLLKNGYIFVSEKEIDYFFQKNSTLN